MVRGLLQCLHQPARHDLEATKPPSDLAMATRPKTSHEFVVHLHDFRQSRHLSVVWVKNYQSHLCLPGRPEQPSRTLRFGFSLAPTSRGVLHRQLGARELCVSDGRNKGSGTRVNELADLRLRRDQAGGAVVHQRHSVLQEHRRHEHCRKGQHGYESGATLPKPSERMGRQTGDRAGWESRLLAVGFLGLGTRSPARVPKAAAP